MIMTIVEGGGKLPKGATAAVFAMLGYVAAASIVAGLGNLGSGLLVLVMGGVAVGIVDYIMWRDVTKDAGGSETKFGSYVLGGPEVGVVSETPSAFGHFDPIRTEGPTPAPTSAPARPAEPEPVHPKAANDAAANDETVASVASSAGVSSSAIGASSASVAAEATTPEEKADAVGVRPPALPVPNGEADDLKRINGIGPANAAKLNALGIYHYDQIAAWEGAHARWVGAYLAFPGRIEREDWVGQARGLAGAKQTA